MWLCGLHWFILQVVFHWLLIFSDFSAIATFGNDLLMLPKKSDDLDISILFRIFVNGNTGSSVNEHGNFLSSFSAFIIRVGSVALFLFAFVLLWAFCLLIFLLLISSIRI